MVKHLSNDMRICSSQKKIVNFNPFLMVDNLEIKLLVYRLYLYNECISVKKIENISVNKIENIFSVLFMIIAFNLKT